MIRIGFRDPSDYKRDAYRVTVVLLVVLILVKACEPYFVNTSDKEHTIGRNMIEQAQNWYQVSIQDQNSQSKYQHISFAAAYLHAARHVVSDSVLERLTGIDVHELQLAIDAQQKNANIEIIRQCPKLKHMPTKPKSKPAWM